jgi:uncharacterized protein YecE (DUF72 family)
MAVKASRYLTHIKRLRDPEEPVHRLLGCIAPLRDAGMLGPILVQLPPDMRRDDALLDAALKEFPRSLQVAVEFRHQSWFAPDVAAVLTNHGAALVWADRGGRSLGPLWETAAWRYLRLHHGRSGWGYDDRDLTRWANRLRASGAGYIYANNDPGAAAVADAARLQQMLGLATREPLHGMRTPH